MIWFIVRWEYLWIFPNCTLECGGNDYTHKALLSFLKKKKKKKKKTQSDTQTQQSGNIWQKRYTVPSAYHICWTGEKK